VQDIVVRESVKTYMFFIAGGGGGGISGNVR